MYVTTETSPMPGGNDVAYRRAVDSALPPARAISPTRVLGWLLRGWPWLAIAALAGAVSAVGAGQLVTPRFTATTELTIAPSNLLIAPNDLYATNIQSDSQILDVESKMRMISSGNVLRRVVEELGLGSDPDFAPSPWIPDFLRASDQPPDAAELAANPRARSATLRAARRTAAPAWGTDSGEGAGR